MTSLGRWLSNLRLYTRYTHPPTHTHTHTTDRYRGDRHVYTDPSDLASTVRWTGPPSPPSLQQLVRLDPSGRAFYLRNDFGSFIARGSRERFGFDVGGTYDGVDVVETVIFSALGAINDGFDVNGESVLKVFISKLALPRLVSAAP